MQMIELVLFGDILKASFQIAPNNSNLYCSMSKKAIIKMIVICKNPPKFLNSLDIIFVRLVRLVVVNRFCEDFVHDFGGCILGDGSHGEAAENFACKGSFAGVTAQLHAGAQEVQFLVV